MTNSNQPTEFALLNNTKLVENLKILVKSERELTMTILKFLEEVQFRRIYNYKYPSLYEFCTRELGYSEGAAQRRIDAMRALRVVPEIAPQIESGALQLSAISKAQSFFRQEQKAGKIYSPSEKAGIFKLMENKSLRDCERELVKISPMSARPEAERMIAENLTELKINLNASMSEKIKKLRALLSNKHPHLTYAELFEITVDMALAKLEVNPRRALSKVFVSTKPTSSERPFSVAKESQRPLPVLSPKPFGASPDSPKASSSSETFSNEVLKTHKNGERMDLSATTRPFGQSQFSTSSIAKKPSGKLEFAKGRSPTKDSRYIPAAVRHHVWMRDHGRCTHPGCDSNHRVHYDHIVPFAFGGKSEVGNLRLLCQTHNLAHARKIFGEFEKGQWNPSKEFNKTPPKEGDLFRSEIHRQRRR